MSLLTIARTVHIAGGATALATFWIPLVARKGARLHRRVGWVYVGAMAVVAASGVALAARFLLDDRPRNDPRALFLIYVALLGAASAWHGVRALARKARTAPARGLAELLLPSLLGVAAVAVVALGVGQRRPLFVAFGALGLLLASGQLRFWLRPPVTRREWFFQHMGGMGGSCIVTLTAFVVVNARRLGLGGFELAVWTTPGLVGGVGLAAWQRYYRRRSAERSARDVARA